MIVELMQYALNDIIDLLKGKMNEKACKYIIAKTLQGLLALHKLNIIHRDIKSDNVLVND